MCLFVFVGVENKNKKLNQIKKEKKQIKEIFPPREKKTRIPRLTHLAYLLRVVHTFIRDRSHAKQQYYRDTHRPGFSISV